MEEKLRDDGHLVRPGEKGEQRGNVLYGYRYDLSIALSKAAAAIPETPPEEVDAPDVPETPTEQTPTSVDDSEEEEEEL